MTLSDTLAQAKWTFATRRVDRARVARADTDFIAAKPGDLILAHVEKIGQHRRVQLPSGRPSLIYPGDAVVMACGARYAPDQFEGLAEIDAQGADLLAGGGCIGRMVARNSRIKPATRLMPSARLLDAAGRAVSLADFAISPHRGAPQTPVIAVLGTAMNSGKTLATAQLVLGLRRAGFRVGAIKATGTGAFGDTNEYSDSGAHYVGDFTDAGMVTTYREPLGRIKAATETLIAEAGAQGCDIVVMEVADGLLQRETAAIIADPWFKALISGLVFACGDAVAAAGGAAMLIRQGLHPDALTGMVSCSPMASTEAGEATGLPVLTKDDLADPAEATGFALRAGLGRKEAA
ncbi:hypothetical protein ACROSR_01545 [Roseovarius tibetensis]|uniref:hypothetical protein n=1 Tax=Roseovarius tibetensis TaxID=2685897 RepID=UPI003D7F71A5